MHVITASFSAVFPLMCFMLTGWILGRAGILTGKAADSVNNMVFRVFLPLSIIENIASTDLGGQFELKCALYVALSCIATYVTLEAIERRRDDPPSVAPVMVQGIHKANYSLLVIPIVSSFFPEDLGMSVVLIAIITPIVNICSTLAFVSRSGRKLSAGELAVKIILNPMVLSSFIGILLNVTGINLPELVADRVMAKMASMATPLAMISLGASFELKAVGEYRKELFRAISGKLVFMPLALVSIAALIGIRGADLIAVLVYSGAPTAVNSYSTAVSMGGDGVLAGQIVALSSAVSIATLFCWLCALGALGLI